MDFVEPHKSTSNVWVLKMKSSKGLVISYPANTNAQSATFLTIDDPAAGPNTVAIIGQVTRKAANHVEIAWKSHTGVLLATQVFQDGKSTVAQAPQTEQPSFNAGCFAFCIGATVDADCALNCATCAGSPTNCVLCIACAGPKALSCIKQCP
jgi:hypothetical protein